MTDLTVLMATAGSIQDARLMQQCLELGHDMQQHCIACTSRIDMHRNIHNRWQNGFLTNSTIINLVTCHPAIVHATTKLIR